MSSSSSTVTGVDEKFRSAAPMIPGDHPSVSTMSQAFHFSSGNPRIEETRGVMHLFSNNNIDVVSSSNLPVGRKPLVCVLRVPNHMTYADFCQFCASFIQHISEMRIVRNDGMDDRYSILIRFDSQDSADKFYHHFNGRQYNSLEAEVCHVLFTVDVQFTGYSGSLEHAQSSPATSTEQPSCPVCLERLDQDTSGILTTICNHSFHCSCISKWTDSSCPVCRYCQQQPEKSICIVCQTSENLWICVICGFVGCGRYKGGHAIIHWKETQHCYSLELETQRVWDYVGDNYVHRLIQSKTDGKLVELNSHCIHANDACGSCDCADSGISEALLNSKVEAIVNEYNELLVTQLENQKSYFETLLQEVKEETERSISEAVNKAVTQRLHKLQAKLDRCTKEKKFLDDLNENLLKNQEIWKAKILEIEEREKKAVRLKDDKIEGLEQQIQGLMLYLEAGKTVEQSLISNNIKDGTVLPISMDSSSSNEPKAGKKVNNR
ncbi:zf-UBP domain-containing protein/BRAP2 domain-containing protein/zf-RING_2 domain-containing protein [Cephalotus follicularis]|uniref:Zf-UBP domain-containing protein/BRAP2 domain-containing protein/zf-RING_2 domain-containing protein n=1 Tax=Cephalotus follicularis TaxID=3775 RepID=A0A1Q3BSG8_CEPFO|nr:zf-UBP domain-containing protein/BRAP2 domain-containing protein/zf-RING_2 domain-containing protein [Cephalotus follicularis]